MGNSSSSKSEEKIKINPKIIKAFYELSDGKEFINFNQFQVNFILLFF